MSRVKLHRGQQKDFLNCVAKHFDFNWLKIAKISNVCERSLRDWRREKCNMGYEALLKLCRISGIQIPKIAKILPEHWSAKKAARLGAIERNKLHGNPGTPEGRTKGGIKSQRLFRLNPVYARKLGVKVRKIIKVPKSSIELAEFIGMMLGDGGITNYQINLTFNRKTDGEYSHYVQRLIQKLFLISASVTPRLSDNTNRIVASARNLVTFLEGKGLKRGNKVKNRVDIPRWVLNRKTYSIACLRGLIDTDGSFYFYRHKIFDKIYGNFAMCFTNNSEPLLKSVYRILRNLDFTPTIQDKRVYLHKQKEIDKYFKEIGTHNSKHLKKYRDYAEIRNS